MVTKPNIVYIMSDDHAAHAMSCYGSKINETPNLDRIANEGIRFTNCFCTNSICTPSRASILTGTYSNVNGVRTLFDKLDQQAHATFPQLLQAAGYETAMVGKWHLGHGETHDPAGFDYWNILPGQGRYIDPEMIELGEKRVFKGYVTNVITDVALSWLQKRSGDKPFCLLCHHKAPHRPWVPHERHAHLYEDVEIPEPETFNDDYSNRAGAAAAARMTIMEDIVERDVKQPIPNDLTGQALKKWKYQRYIKDYLRCVAAVDESVGRLLDYLDLAGLAENTIVIYASDQGFFLGDHGWYDKRFMYEESLRMPFVARYPGGILAGVVNSEIVLNVDFAPTFLDLAGLPAPAAMQGVSMKSLLRGESAPDWRKSLYYHYSMNNDPQVNVYPHYGVRTERYKLIYYYGAPQPEWELFDLQTDPCEMTSVYDVPAYASVVSELKGELEKLRHDLGDDMD